MTLQFQFRSSRTAHVLDADDWLLGCLRQHTVGQSDDDTTLHGSFQP